MAQEHKGDFCPRCGEHRLFLRDLHNSGLAIHIIISIFFWPWLFVLIIVALCSSPRWLCTKCGGPPLAPAAYRPPPPMMMSPQPMQYLPPQQYNQPQYAPPQFIQPQQYVPQPQIIDVPQPQFKPPPPLPPPVPRIEAKPTPPKPPAPKGPNLWERFLDSL